MKELTARQKEILTFIEKYEWRHGFWPSIREIQEKFSFKSTNAVMGHLRALEKKGAIARIHGQARTFRIHPSKPANGCNKGLPSGRNKGSSAASKKARAASRSRSTSQFGAEEMEEMEEMEVVDIPVMGDIAAGYPDRVEPAGEIGRLQVDIRSAGYSERRRTFALQVRGDSMVDAEIYDGDMVIVEPREPRDGDVVAALIDGETTLKRYIKKRGAPPYLKAENKFYPELYPINELCVQGVAKAVVRSL